MARKVRKPDSQRKGKGNIPPVQPLPGKITFSFEFYDLESDEFCLSKWNQQQIKRALDRLRDINSKTFNELNSARKVLHFHEVEWEKTEKKTGFTNEKAQHLNENAWQIALLTVNNQLTRVFGAYTQNVFYIVWFDLNHEIWPSKLRNT